MSEAAIPEGWELVDLGTLGVFAKGSGIRKDEALSGEIPAVRYGELYTYHQEILRAHQSYISAEISKSARPIKCGDILIAGSGETKEEIGKCTGFLGDYEAFAGGDIIIFRPNGADPRFLSYLLNSRPIAQQKAQRAQGDAVVHIYPGALSKLRLPLPPLYEQQAIAAALSDADGVVAGLERVIAKKRLIKQGAMQDLLTARRRLPGFSGQWEVTKLGELGQFFKGSGVRKDDAKSGELPCVRYGELYTIHHDVVRHFASHISEEVARTARTVRRGDVLFAGSGETKEEIGKCAVINHDGPVYAGGDIVGFRPTNANGIFLSYLLNAPAAQKQKASRGQGDAVVHISASALSDIQVSLPSNDEQRVISTVLEDMDAEIQTLESRLTKARAVKEGMMQNLLTGRVRLV